MVLRILPEECPPRFSASTVLENPIDASDDGHIEREVTYLDSHLIGNVLQNYQHPLAVAVVLIDELRVPLVISGETLTELGITDPV